MHFLYDPTPPIYFRSRATVDKRGHVSFQDTEQRILYSPGSKPEKPIPLEITAGVRSATDIAVHSKHWQLRDIRRHGTVRMLALVFLGSKFTERLSHCRHHDPQHAPSDSERLDSALYDAFLDEAAIELSVSFHQEGAQPRLASLLLKLDYGRVD